jgi:hypothetical protein
VLAVRLFTHTTESMTTYNTLETLSFGGTYYFNFITFGENVDRDGIANVLVYFAIADFFYELFVVCFSFLSPNAIWRAL